MLLYNVHFFTIHFLYHLYKYIDFSFFLFSLSFLIKQFSTGKYDIEKPVKYVVQFRVKSTYLMKKTKYADKFEPKMQMLGGRIRVLKCFSF